MAAAVTYIPQHPLGLPFLFAVLVSLRARRRKAVIINLCLSAVFFVVFMGFAARLPANEKGDLRVMTTNVHQSAGNIQALVRTIGQVNPDVLFVQEAVPIKPRKDALEAIIKSPAPNGDDWHLARTRDVAILSKMPVANVRNVVLLPGSGRRMLVANVSARGKNVTLACIHYATNTPGASRRHPSAYLRGSAKSRMIQTQVLLASLPASNTIVAGDFNTPPRGHAYGRITRKYADAFAAGSGFGYTFSSDLPLMRIDHVFVSRDLSPVAWRTIDSAGSDHRAVVVDIAVRQ